MLQGPVLAAVIIRDQLKIPLLHDLTNESLVESLIETALAALLTDQA